MGNSSDDYAIKLDQVSKAYQLYDSSFDRLKEALHPLKKRYYKNFQALSDISFALPKGKAYGIIGFNGSGKSTLLKIICGVTKETSGCVEVQGKISALLELGAGFNPEFTGRQNIFFSGILSGISREKMKLRYDEIVAFADIGEYVEQPVKSYSSGMLMRLAFSVAIHVDPEILVIDEALAVGDARFRHKCIARIRELKERCTILFVSHDMNAILSLCDRAIWLNKGRMVMLGDPKELARLYTEATYEGADKVSARQVTLESKPEVTAVSASSATVEAGAGDAVSSEKKRADSFGRGKAEILSSQLLGINNEFKENVFCGDELILVFSLQLKENLERPIVGFAVSDGIGLRVIGVHDPITNERELALFVKDNLIEVRYRFVWPDLQAGTYSFTVAIADGLMEDHEQQHWIHEALVVNCIREKPLYGMYGIEYNLAIESVSR